MKRIDTRVIAIENIHACPYNVRKDYGDLSELIASIKSKGVLFDISVIEESKDNYVVYAGNRRLEASKRAGLKELNCVVWELDKGETIEAMLIENMQREGLSAKETADGFQMMLDLGATVESISKSSGFSKRKVKMYADLSKLDGEKFAKADEREPDLAQYAKLLSLKDENERNILLESVGTNNFDYQFKKAQDREALEYFKKEHIKLLKKAGVTELGVISYVNGGYRLKLGEDKYSEETYKSVHSYNAWQYINNKGGYEFALPNINYEITSLYYAVKENTYWCLELYKLNDENEPISEEQLLKNHKEEVSKKAHTDAMNKEFLFHELHFEFIKNFSAFKKYRDVLTKHYALLTTIGLYNYHLNTECFKEITGLEIEEGLQIQDKIAKWITDEEISLKVQYAILFSALYQKHSGYIGTTWNYDAQIYLLKYRKDTCLDLFYCLLLDLDYKMSEEEEMYYNAIHPMFYNEWANEFLPASEDCVNEE